MTNETSIKCYWVLNARQYLMVIKIQSCMAYHRFPARLETLDYNYRILPASTMFTLKNAFYIAGYILLVTPFYSN